jgi:uncharacterized protein
VCYTGYWLASLLLGKGIQVISPRGRQFMEESVDLALNIGYLPAKERRIGYHSRGLSPYKSEDRVNFQFTLEKICRILKGKMDSHRIK